MEFGPLDKTLTREGSSGTKHNTHKNTVEIINHRLERIDNVLLRITQSH